MALRLSVEKHQKLSELDAAQVNSLLSQIFYRQLKLKDPSAFPRLDTRKPVLLYFKKTIENYEKTFPGSTVQDIYNFYNLNDYGLRSEEFTESHNGKHVLFAGCSNTFGMGVPLNSIWPKLVYEKLSSTEQLSGFFNIGISGASILEIYNQTIAYIKKFGVPDVLFVNLPDHGREIGRFGRRMRPHDVKAEDFDITFLKEVNAGYYQLFVSALKNFGTEVYFISWDHAMTSKENVWKNDDPRFLMNNLSVSNVDDASSHIFEYYKANENSPYKKFFTTSLDEDHPGLGMHSYWADMAYNKYINKNTEDPFF